MKNCNKCNIDKSLSDFNKDKSKKDGHDTICRECKRNYKKGYWEENGKNINFKNRSKTKEHFKDFTVKNLPEEIWKGIEGLEDLYQISNKGRVKSLNYRKQYREGILSCPLNKRGYPSIRITNGDVAITQRVHRLVAKAFKSNPNNLPEVNHKDGVKTNNNEDNLEWCDGFHNQQHAWATGLRKSPPKGKDSPHATSIKQYDKGGNFIKKWGSLSEVTRELNITSGNISKSIKRNGTAGGFIWKY